MADLMAEARHGTCALQASRRRSLTSSRGRDSANACIIAVSSSSMTFGIGM